MNDFERFIAIDWSGAEGEGQRGIQVAQIHRQAKRLELIPPKGRNWSRHDVLQFLRSLTDRRTLVGLDFAFSVPWHGGQGSIPACLGELGGVHDLWAFIDCLCEDAPHFYGGPIWASDQSPFRPFIKLWSRAIKYEREVVEACLLRKTEIAAKKCGLRPISIYRMTGPQVGAGSFAGMRVLHALASGRGSDIAIWPFDRIEKAMVVIVEIYPALFYEKAARRRPTKSQIKSGSYARIVADVLQCYGCRCKVEIPDAIDAIDALVSAAAMCSLSEQSDFLSVPIDADVSMKEGWIFGVPAGRET